ncbi:MAG: hypothetical protein R3320_04165, partial [Nitriliruptorales bacterium]|nr:hypothetical protein [Nitriliruptorales bacterium]
QSWRAHDMPGGGSVLDQIQANAARTPRRRTMSGLAPVPYTILTVLGMWAVLAMLLVLSSTADDATTRLTRTLSARSYLIYLYHPPIVAGLAGVFGSSIVTGRPVTATLGAVTLLLAVGGLSVVAFPRHARRWLGA